MRSGSRNRTGERSCSSRYLLTISVRRLHVKWMYGWMNEWLETEWIIIRATSPCLQGNVINRSLWAQLLIFKGGELIETKASSRHWREKKGETHQTGNNNNNKFIKIYCKMFRRKDELGTSWTNSVLWNFRARSVVDIVSEIVEEIDCTPSISFIPLSIKLMKEVTDGQTDRQTDKLAQNSLSNRCAGIK